MSTPLCADALLYTLESFCLSGKMVSCKPYGGGHINSTQLVTDDTGKRYMGVTLSQRIFTRSVFMYRATAASSL